MLNGVLEGGLEWMFRGRARISDGQRTPRRLVLGLSNGEVEVKDSLWILQLGLFRDWRINKTSLRTTNVQHC